MEKDEQGTNTEEKGEGDRKQELTYRNLVRTWYSKKILIYFIDLPRKEFR